MPSPSIPRALEIFRSKVSALDSELTPLMTEKAFFTAKVTNLAITEDLRKVLLSTLEKGLPSSAFVAEARRVLQNYGAYKTDFVDDEARAAYHNDVRNLGGRNRLELIFRVNNEQAYSLANWRREMTVQRIREAPAYRYVRHAGAKEPRPLHVQYERAVRFKWDYDFWASRMNSASIGGFEKPWTPHGYNSYMAQIPVEDFELDKGMLTVIDGMSDDDIRAKIAEGEARFGVSLSDAYEDAGGELSVKEFSPEQQDKLVFDLEKEGITVDIIDGKAKIKPKTKVTSKKGDVTFELDDATKKRLEKKSAPTPQAPPKETKEPKKLPKAKTREESIENTKTLLDSSNGKGVTWGDNVSKDTIDEFNETLFDLKEKYPTDSFVQLGSYKDKNGGVGAHANHMVLEVNHNDRTEGIHGLGGWKSYILPPMDAAKKAAREQVERLEILGKEFGWTERKAKGEIYDGDRFGWRYLIKKARKQLEYYEKEHFFKRHNVGASEKGISLKDLITHEYGHSIHYQVMYKTPNGFALDAEIEKIFAKAKRNNDIFKISEYSKKNYHEFFAETFTMYERGDDLPKYIVDMLVKVTNALKTI